MRREALEGWWGGPMPDRDDWGVRYPARQVMLHANSREFARRRAEAVDVVRSAMARADAWQASVSGGKDSTALALVLREAGVQVPMLSLRDDLCWEGEKTYLQRVALEVGCSLELPWVQIDTSRPLDGSTDDQRRGALSGPWFDAANRTRAGRSMFWGLRAEENKRRRMLLWSRGAFYQIADGTWRAAPLRAWTALDVHAMLWAHRVPLHPVYGCIDIGADALAMRHSWFVVGLDTYMAELHFQWLQRWWPATYRRAALIWPDIRHIG
jgi:3'-phosphoadenosine 5'-phosphosulfate sulfotransferase (PAPS reductase)/FAD synthetase